MPYQKGQSGNLTGRPKGAKNKAGAELREKIGDFLSLNFETLADDFLAMQPQERLRMFATLLPYCIGKKQDFGIDNQLGQLSDDQLDSILRTIEDHEPEEEN